jgi:hypothetical protein
MSGTISELWGKFGGKVDSPWSIVHGTFIVAYDPYINYGLWTMDYQPSPKSNRHE